jgi:DNA-directed RNA polymerase subunit beta'
VRLTEWNKNKETGEFEPVTRSWKPPWAVPAVGNPAQGPAVQQLNKALKKKEISKLINASFRKCGLKATVVFADKLLQSVSAWPRAGISIASTTCWCRRKRPTSWPARSEVKEIEQQYVSGLVTAGERTTRWWTSGARPATTCPR